MKINGIEIEERHDMVCLASTNGEFEPESFDVWRQYSLPNTFVLDIGSYNGIYAIDACSRGCVVHAFEPNPHNMISCKANALTNGCKPTKLIFHQNAASDVSGAVVPFSIKKGLPTTSASKIGVVKDGGDTWRTVDVTTLRVDNIPLGDVSVIKIDVEGHELNVLKGAKNTINRDRPAIILESMSPEHEIEITEFLNQFSYRLERRLDEINLLFLGW